MLARLQRFITLTLLALAIAWAWGFSAAGYPTWAAAGALLITFNYAAFLALEFVMVARVHGDDPTPPATAGQLLRAWWHETLTAPRVFCWQQPFRSQRYPDHLPGDGQALGRRGVVLVHGFVCNRGFWNRWMPRLQSQGIPFVAVNLEPVFGSISGYTAMVEAAVQQVERATGQPPVLVGHSMGGLAIRVWLAAQRGSERVHRVITIGSPHHGTWLARFAFSRNGQEMAQAAGWREVLQGQEAVRAQPFERFTCFYSHCDNIVFPASTATLPGADNRHLAGIAHVQLADQPEVFSEVLAWLKPGSAGVSDRVGPAVLLAR